MEEQKNENTDWLTEELKETKTTAFDEDRAPALKLEENKITEMTIDFTKPFEKWTDLKAPVELMREEAIKMLEKHEN